MGNRVRQLRLQRGWSLTELSRITGLDVGWLSRVERGRKEPTSRTIKALMAAFKMNAHELFPDLLIRPDADNAKSA